MDAWIGMVLASNHAQEELEREEVSKLPGDQSERPSVWMRVTAYCMVAVAIAAGVLALGRWGV